MSPCDGGISREHYFTRGIFLSDSVNIDGPLPSGLTSGKRYINDLVTKCLCRRHNAQLSHLDQALVDLVNAFRELDRLRNVRGKLKRRWATPTRYVVDGPRIERCLLKMIMTHARLQREHINGWEPPSWLPDVVFGTRALPTGCGMSMVARINDEIEGLEKISFAFGTDANGQPDCAMMEIRRGWRFFCAWDRPLPSTGYINYAGDIYERGSILFHAKRVDFSHTPTTPLGLSLDFDWSGRWSARRHANVVRLRDTFKAPSRPGR